MLPCTKPNHYVSCLSRNMFDIIFGFVFLDGSSSVSIRFGLNLFENYERSLIYIYNFEIKLRHMLILFITRHITYSC